MFGSGLFSSTSWLLSHFYWISICVRIFFSFISPISRNNHFGNQIERVTYVKQRNKHVNGIVYGSICDVRTLLNVHNIYMIDVREIDGENWDRKRKFLFLAKRFLPDLLRFSFSVALPLPLSIYIILCVHKFPRILLCLPLVIVYLILNLAPNHPVKCARIYIYLVCAK